MRKTGRIRACPRISPEGEGKNAHSASVKSTYAGFWTAPRSPDNTAVTRKSGQYLFGAGGDFAPVGNYERRPGSFVTGAKVKAVSTPLDL